MNETTGLAREVGRRLRAYSDHEAQAEAVVAEVWPRFVAAEATPEDREHLRAVLVGLFVQDEKQMEAALQRFSSAGLLAMIAWGEAGGEWEVQGGRNGRGKGKGVAGMVARPWRALRGLLAVLWRGVHGGKRGVGRYRPVSRLSQVPRALAGRARAPGCLEVTGEP